MAVLEELEPSGNVQRKATLLLGEILQISNRVLPLNIAADVQVRNTNLIYGLSSFTVAFSHCHDFLNSLPISIASMSQDGWPALPSRRSTASTVIAHVYESLRQRIGDLGTTPLMNYLQYIEVTSVSANSIEDTVRRNQRQVEQVKMKLSLQIDDKAFQDIVMRTQVSLHQENGTVNESLIFVSKVISQKDATKWNLDALFEVIEGPLMNPKRLEEAFRVLKFGKRLLSFFHPFSNRFSSLKITNVRRFRRLSLPLLI